MVNTVLGYRHLNFGSQSQLLCCDLALEKVHDVHLLGIIYQGQLRELYRVVVGA